MSNITLKELLDIGILIDDTTPLLKKRDKTRYKLFFTETTFKIEKIDIHPYPIQYYITYKYYNGREYYLNHKKPYKSLEEAEATLADSLVKFIINRLFDVRKNHSDQVAELLRRETILNLKTLYSIYKSKPYHLSYFLYNTELKDKEFRAKDIIKRYIKKEFELHGESICL